MRGPIYLLGAALAALAASPPAYAQSRGQYGGGFIEYMMTGGPAGTRAASPHASQDDGLLPRHSTAYGHRAHAGMIATPDPMAGYRASPAGSATRVAALSADWGDEGASIGRAIGPRYARQRVPFEGRQKPGTILIDTNSRHLYLVQPGGQAIRYGIGVGRPGFLWTGVKTISAKKEWPDWTPPPEMMLRRPDLPPHMAGGLDNPLGARAMYLGTSLYRIHGTNEPHTIGQAVSSGCIRMMNEDVIDLYERTRVGTRVEVI